MVAKSRMEALEKEIGKLSTGHKKLEKKKSYLHIGMLALSNVRESLEEELRTARSNVQKVQATMSDAEMNTEELQNQIVNLQKKRGMSNVVCEGLEADLLEARSESTDSSAKTKSELAKWPFTKQPLSKND